MYRKINIGDQSFDWKDWEKDFPMLNRLLFIFFLLFTFSFLCHASELTNLRVNRMTNPKGIVRKGQFSWQIISEENDIRQLAYHIKVASTEEGLQGGPTLMWDSERRESSDMIQIFYQGRRFPYESTVYWQLEVWLSNDEHLKSPVQIIKTGSKGSEWNGTPVTKNEEKHDYFYYLRWLHTLQMNQADSGELFLPVPNDTSSISVDRVAAILYSLYKEEGDVKALYDYYNMVNRWMMFRCQKDSTVSSQLISMMTEMAQCQNLQSDVLAYSRLRSDTTAYAPFWLYTDEPEWCRGAITQTASGIAYNRVDMTIPSHTEISRDSITHECPYGSIRSEWIKEEGGAISWEIQIPVGVQARLLYPKGYADEDNQHSQVIGSGCWIVRLLPMVYDDNQP